MKQDAIIKMVNDAVIQGLQKEGFNWFKSWKAGAENQPFNLATKTYYNGFNIFLLNAVARLNGYQYNQWLTFNQVNAKKGKVIKGSKSTPVFKFNIGYQDMKTGKYLTPQQVKEVDLKETFELNGKQVKRYREIFTWKYYSVFNVEQCEGITPVNVQESTIVHEPIESAETISKSYIDKDGKLQLIHGGSQASYNPMIDVVKMPEPKYFIDSDSYYKVLFHELAHSTGHESRLNRKTLTEVAKWGDNSYAQEELVAEISAMYLTGFCGLNPKDNIENSQAYIKGWCKHLEDKPKECFYAMQQASKVVEYISK